MVKQEVADHSPKTKQSTDVPDADDSAQYAHNCMLYKNSIERQNMLHQRQGEEDDKIAKWLMTFAAGSFGLSFAFIDKIVPIANANQIPLLIAAWSCFIMVLILGLLGSLASSIVHSVMAKEEADLLPLRYEGKEPEYRKRSIFFGSITILIYTSIASFSGGSLCLLLFIAKNLL